ncbi:MAG: winged helix-turn-helix domain-containing protein [Acidobacteriota bacterium]|nr:winged helix-turn-helix domain-containing protein [Acidobacteriota bacterium]
MVAQPKHIYEFGPFRLIASERQLLRHNQPVSITPKSFDLLVLLVENSGRLVEKEELMKRIWPDSFVEEANLSVNVSALRRALGEGPDDHQYVETVPRHGYRFVADVRERWENGAESSSPVSGNGHIEHIADSQTPAPYALPADASSPHLSFRRWSLVAVGSLLLVGSLVALNPAGLRDRLLGNRNPIRIQSLAVLPLKNASGDAAQDYFAAGLTDSLINDLAKIDTLRVMSRALVMRYKDAQNSRAEIGRDLKVDAVVTGSVSRTGDRVRVVLQLMHVPTGRNLWSADYDRDLRDSVTLQSEVRRAVAEKIGLKTPPQQQEATAPSVNPESYDQYLRGRFYLYRQTREDNEAAIAALEQAVAKDPNFAAAHAELAQAYVWKLFLFTPGEKQLEEKAFIAVEKALALDSNSAVAYLARGRLLWTPANHFPHDRAIKEYRHALALNPSLDEARNQLALVYCHIGAFHEALQESQLALTTDPNNNLAQFRIAQTLNFQGKYDEALSVLHAIREDANPVLVGHQTAWALFNLGRKEESSATLEQLLKAHPEDTGGVFTSIQAVLAASAGQERVAEDKIKSAIEKGKGFGHFHHTAYHIACAYALMNKPEPAIKWLEVTADDGFPCYPLFERDSNLGNLRQDARFVAFLAKLRQRWEYYRTIL